MYVYDPTASLAANVVKERFNVSSNVQEFQIWVPHAAPFFSKDLKIRNVLTGELLVYGQDYVFSDDLSVENRVVETNIYNTVIFVGKSKFGMYEGEYRTVGGGLTFATRDYFIKLARELLDPVRILYSHVLNIPASFPPDHHLHDWSDYRNKQYIGVTISAITSAIRAFDNAGTLNLAPLQQELDDITKYLDTVDLEGHVLTDDPHGLTAEDIGALPYGATANDAMKAFDKTLLELTEYIRNKQALGIKLSDYAEVDTSSHLKRIVLAGEASIGTPGNESTMRIVGDNVFYESKGSVDFTSNVDNVNVLTIQAGKNILTLESSPFGFGSDALRLNGKPVMTGMNISFHLSTLSFDEQTVVTKNNDMAIIRGDGSSQNPLEVTVILQDATDIQAGVAFFTRAWGTSKMLVMESDLVKGLMVDLTGYVPRERKINGYSITDNIVIPASDPNINLGNVDNTSDVEKPVSTAQQTLLNDYSPQVHSHASYTPPTATTTVAGIGKLNTSWTGTQTGFITPAGLSFLDGHLKLSKGIIAVYAGEPVDPTAIYAVIRNVPTVKRGSKINLVAGEQYMVIK